MLTGGIDVGAVSAKAAIVKDDELLFSSVIPTGSDAKKSALEVMHMTLDKANLTMREIELIVATGYGRFTIPFAQKQVTEITCHAKGASFLYPDTRTIIDMGGQDSKAIRINEHGEVMDFVMNDKCAAGTGRFLEVMAKVLEIDIEHLGELSLRSKNIINISSMCTVFAESEVVSLIASGAAREDIALGLHRAVVERVVGMTNKIRIAESVTLTGGVINNIGVVHALKEKLEVNINIPENPQIVGALGAAIIAKGYCQVHKFDYKEP